MLLFVPLSTAKVVPGLPNEFPSFIIAQNLDFASKERFCLRFEALECAQSVALAFQQVNGAETRVIVDKSHTVAKS
jgi:hypothetical protein